MTIRTSGRKDSNCADMLDGNPVCGSWSTLREYFVYLPTGYDIDKPYPLIFQAPGCGGGAQDVYSLSGNVSNTVIRVGLAPGPNSTGHGTNENQRCFDDKEGDDSIDWVFYEKLYDQLNQQLCFDRNRVFALGNSSGAWLANELGCKYAGDSLRPIRGIGAHAGGLPTEAKFVPHCTTAPLAGFWVHEVNNLTTPFSSAKVAITRAMATAGCALNSSYDNASFESFPIGGGVADGTCQRIVGCDPLIPLVVCPLPGNNHGSNDNVVNNGFSTFVKLFSAGSFITQ
jgi:poly(3-hydroxybutyrate) depolymerase